MKLKKESLIIILTILSSCNYINTIQPKNNDEKFTFELINTDYSKFTPIEALDSVAKGNNYQEFNNIAFFNISPKNWITKLDVQKLMTYINDTTQCGIMYNASLSHFYSWERSMKGKQALYLIEGYRYNKFPPSLTSYDRNYDVNEYEIWWDSIK